MSETFTVELSWWTGDEWSDHWIEVKVEKFDGFKEIRDHAIRKLKIEWELIDAPDIEIYCRAIFRGQNLWEDEFDAKI